MRVLLSAYNLNNLNIQLSASKINQWEQAPYPNLNTLNGSTANERGEKGFIEFQTFLFTYASPVYSVYRAYITPRVKA